MDKFPSFIPLVVAIFFIRNMIKIGTAAARRQGGKKRSNSAGAAQYGAPSSGTSNSASNRPKPLNSAPPKPWQIGKHDVKVDKAVLNGKGRRGKAFGQRVKNSNYESAFEDRGLLSGGTISAFGDERDVISSGSMAAGNAAYMDVGNDYVSSFDVGGRRETHAGFDR
ncbi:MAG: hypothetical protein IJS33_00175 [Firmicutes bacterium]|nr:hypothetical protein [Bacillota bacterium]